jgi:hypothetical protein
MARARFNADVRKLLEEHLGEDLYSGDEGDDAESREERPGEPSVGLAWRPADDLVLPTAAADSREPSAQLLNALRHYLVHGRREYPPIGETRHPQAHCWFPFFYDYEPGVVEVYMINLHPTPLVTPEAPQPYCRVRFYRATDYTSGGGSDVEFLEIFQAHRPRGELTIPYPRDLRCVSAADQKNEDSEEDHEDADRSEEEYVSEVQKRLEEDSGMRRPPQ